MYFPVGIRLLYIVVNHVHIICVPLRKHGSIFQSYFPHTKAEFTKIIDDNVIFHFVQHPVNLRADLREFVSICNLILDFKKKEIPWPENI